MKREIVAQKCHHGHNQFLLEGHVQAHRASADGPPTCFTLDLQLRCGVCGELFTFEGIPTGDAGELYKPVTDLSGAKLRLPVRPVDPGDRRHYRRGELPVLHLPKRTS